MRQLSILVTIYKVNHYRPMYGLQHRALAYVPIVTEGHLVNSKCLFYENENVGHHTFS